MAIHYGDSNNMAEVNFGDTKMGKVYFGDQLVWQKAPAFTPPTITHNKQTNFTIQVYCYSYNTVTINWGDGSSTLVNNNTSKTHTYSSSGDFNVTLTGDVTQVTYIFCANQSVKSVFLAPECTRMFSLDFNGNIQLTSFSIPSEYTALKTVRLYSSGVTSFTIPSTITSMTDIQLYSCASLTSVNISSITSITDKFYAYSCALLTSINVSNLATCNDFRVNNTAISSIDVSNLTTCNSNFSVNSTNLTSITTYFPGSVNLICRIDNNINLSSANLSSLTAVASLYMQLNSALTSINLNNLTYCPVFSCYNTGLISLTTYFSGHSAGDYYCYGNSALTSINANALATCSRFRVHTNANLTSLSINNLTTCTSDFYVYSNKLTSLTTYITGGSALGFRAENNPSLVSLTANNLTSVAAFDCYNNTNQTSLSINNLVTCNGNFRVYSTKIPSLTTYITGGSSCYFYVNYNSQLTTINANSLTASAGISIDNNPLLTSVGFAGYTSTALSSYLANNCTSLTSLTVPASVRTMTTLNVSGNTAMSTLNLPALTAITNLYAQTCGVTSITIPSGVMTMTNLYAYSCPSLTSINCGSATTITNLRAYSSTSLSSVPMNSVTNCQSLLVYSVNSLTPPALSQLTSVASIQFMRSGLTQARVDNILNQCLAISLVDTSCTLNLGNSGSGGALNVAPSAQGLVDKATLIARGWSVTTA
jgi:hypothetical protein